MSVTVLTHITLDGVVQAPARADEDPRDGFSNGGWGAPYVDETVTAAWGEVIGRATRDSGAFLFGRRTYLDLADVWSKRVGNPYTETLTNTRKYVASTTLIHSLARTGLIDEYVLTIHPLVLGAGRRLFSESFAYTELDLVEAKPTPTGVIIARYHSVAVD